MRQRGRAADDNLDAQISEIFFMSNEEILVQQQRWRLRNARRERVLVIAGLASALLVVLVLSPLWWFPLRVLMIKGEERGGVIARLGPPQVEWGKAEFQCMADWPCTVSKVQGGVLFYPRMGVGFYLYLDEHGRVAEVEVSGS